MTDSTASTAVHVPHEDIERVLFDEAAIRARVAELGRKISEDYKGRPLVLIGVLKGSLFFLSDLSRKIEIPHKLDLVGARSYVGAGSSGSVSVTKDLDFELRGKDVLIVEDIYDSGRTLKVIRDMVALERPASIEICAMLWKDLPSRACDLEVRYVGFHVENVFVVGYGLDYLERYRHLDYIGVLSPEVYR